MTGRWPRILCFVWATMILAEAPLVRSIDLGNEKATLSFDGAFSEVPPIRQEFCERYREMVSTGNSISVENALSGSELRVSIDPGEYFRYTDEEGIDPVYPGIHAELLDYIAEKGNFTWRNSFGIWTREQKGNRTITELLEWGTETYDVMVGTFTPSLPRINLGVSFVEGHFDGSLIMARVVEPEVEGLEFFNFLRPFTTAVWVMIVVVTFFSALAYLAIESIGAERGEEDPSLRAWMMGKLYLSFINLTGNYVYEPRTLGGRVFGFFFAFWAMLISATYTANLASLLVVQGIEPPISDIRGAVKQGLPICVHDGSYSHDLMKKNYPESIENLVPLPRSELYKALNENKCEIMIAYKQEFDSKRQRIDSNPDCKLEWQGRKIESLMDGFATKLDPGIRCTGLVNEVLSYYMREMETSGFLEEKWQEHNDFWSNFYGGSSRCESDSSTGQRNRRLKGGGGGGGGAAAAVGGAESTASQGNGSEDDVGQLGLKDMAGTLLFMVYGSVAAVVISLVSGFDRKTNEKRNVKRAINNIGKLTEKIQQEGFSGSIVMGAHTLRRRHGERKKRRQSSVAPRFSTMGGRFSTTGGKSSEDLNGLSGEEEVDMTGRLSSIMSLDMAGKVSSDDDDECFGSPDDESVSSEASLQRKLGDLTQQVEIVQSSMKKELDSLNSAVQKMKKALEEKGHGARRRNRRSTSTTFRVPED